MRQTSSPSRPVSLQKYMKSVRGLSVFLKSKEVMFLFSFVCMLRTLSLSIVPSLLSLSRFHFFDSVSRFICVLGG